MWEKSEVIYRQIRKVLTYRTRVCRFIFNGADITYGKQPKFTEGVVKKQRQAYYIYNIQCSLE